MNVVFLGCYFNHHQRYLCDALSRLCHFHFIATTGYNPARLALGWKPEEEPAYVCHYDRQPETAQRLLEGAQVILTGSAPEQLVQQCIKRNQLVLRYSERPLKNGSQWGKFLPRLLKWRRRNPRRRKIYLLCASAYTATDYARFGLFRGRAYRWGYFPEQKVYPSGESLLSGKKPGSILWAGRFLDWKHPEAALTLAGRLKEAGCDFTMELVGTGPMEEPLKQRIIRDGLQEQVSMPGSMSPREVRSRMEQAEIFLFTSGRGEGWGVVLNEAMNSGCCVAANRQAGASRFLVRDGENGVLYDTDDELYHKISQLLAAPEQLRKLGGCAYETILNDWNPDAAARRLLELSRGLLQGKEEPPFKEGPCSAAPIVREER